MEQGERDAAILEHVRCFHLTTPEVLHDLFFPGVTQNAVTKVTTRLIREKRIQRGNYPGPNQERRRYFVLTPREAVRLGEDRCIGTTYQLQGLVNALAVLIFCTRHGFRPFSRREFDAKFPELVIPGVRAGNYYIDADRSTEPPVRRLGFILVDYGSSLRLVEKKVTKIISRAYTRAEFAKTIQGGRFVITVLAPTAMKADAIDAMVKNAGIANVHFRVEVIEALAPLLMGMGKKDRTRPGAMSDLPDSEAPAQSSEA